MTRQFARAVLSTLAVSAVVAACTDHSIAPDAPSTARPSIAPVYGLGSSDAIPNRYIVVFRKDVRDAKGLGRELARENGGRIENAFDRSIKGFTVTLSASKVGALLRNPNIAFIEQDRKVFATSVQSNVEWGLGRVDQRDGPADTEYNYNATGAGVNIYVIDTGIRTDHADFGSRASVGFDVFGGDGQDCSGHGTHVAGIAGGTTYGVAKEANLIAVRVLNCYSGGTVSGIIAGIDWVTANHQKPAVANVSLGTIDSPALDQAVANSIAAGVTYALAAGNHGFDACQVSPARVSEALTVGSSNVADSRSTWSNWGGCLDIFAPGEGILSASHLSDVGTTIMNGTSMAAPFVAGVAALYLQNATLASPAEVAEAIAGSATLDKVVDAGDASPNRLLFSLLTTESSVPPPPEEPPPPPPPPPPPVAPCTDCEKYAGEVWEGESTWEPEGSVYSESGSQEAWLEGPADADFQLYLWRYRRGSWSIVARSEGEGASEHIKYHHQGAASYAWQVVSARGSGSYTFWLKR